MTVKTIHYDTRAEMKIGKRREANNGFRALNTDFTNNNEADGFEVFFSDLDIHNNAPAKTANELRFEVLTAKVLDDTITNRELIEYERLKINLGR